MRGDDGWERNEYVVRASPEVFEDAFSIRGAMQEAMLDWLNPWRKPDRNPIPVLVPFPQVAHWIAQATEARARIVAAVDVLRYGVPDHEDY